MATALFIEIPAGTAETYEARIEQLVKDGKRIPGLLLHLSGPTNRGWRAIEVWESRQAFDAVARRGRGDEPPATTELEIRDMLEFGKLRQGVKAVGFVIDASEGSEQSYESAMAALKLDGTTMPAGGVLHIAGRSDDHWKIVEVWESRDAFRGFYDGKLRPAMQDNGVRLSEPEEFPVHNLLLYTDVRTPPPSL